MVVCVRAVFVLVEKKKKTTHETVLCTLQTILEKVQSHNAVPRTDEVPADTSQPAVPRVVPEPPRVVAEPPRVAEPSLCDSISEEEHEFDQPLCDSVSESQRGVRPPLFEPDIS